MYDLIEFNPGDTLLFSIGEDIDIDSYKDIIENKMSPAELDDNGNVLRNPDGTIKRKPNARLKNAQHRIYIPISPLHGCCIVADPYRATKVPLLAALLPDSLDILEYKNIQKQKSIYLNQTF